MAYTYIIDPVAANEYEEAFTWYEKRSATAADKFVIALYTMLLARAHKEFKATR